MERSREANEPASSFCMAPQFVIASHCATGTSPTNTMVTRLTVSLPGRSLLGLRASETARRTPVNEGTSSRLSRDLKCIDDADHANNLKVQSTSARARKN